MDLVGAAVIAGISKSMPMKSILVNVILLLQCLNVSSQINMGRLSIDSISYILTNRVNNFEGILYRLNNKYSLIETQTCKVFLLNESFQIIDSLPIFLPKKPSSPWRQFKYWFLSSRRSLKRTTYKIPIHVVQADKYLIVSYAGSSTVSVYDSNGPNYLTAIRRKGDDRFIYRKSMLYVPADGSLIYGIQPWDFRSMNSDRIMHESLLERSRFKRKKLLKFFRIKDAVRFARWDSTYSKIPGLLETMGKYYFDLDEGSGIVYLGFEATHTISLYDDKGRLQRHFGEKAKYGNSDTLARLNRIQQSRQKDENDYDYFNRISALYRDYYRKNVHYEDIFIDSRSGWTYRIYRPAWPDSLKGSEEKIEKLPVFLQVYNKNGQLVKDIPTHQMEFRILSIKGQQLVVDLGYQETSYGFKNAIGYYRID